MINEQDLVDKSDEYKRGFVAGYIKYVTEQAERIAKTPANPYKDYQTLPLVPCIPSPFSVGDSKCRVCGLSYKDMTNYVCPQANCPGTVTVTYGSAIVQNNG